MQVFSWLALTPLLVAKTVEGAGCTVSSNGDQVEVGSVMLESCMHQAKNEDHVAFECPTMLNNTLKQYEDNTMYYNSHNKRFFNNLTNFRTRPAYDGRVDNYNENKEKTTWFKTHFFGSVLRSGDTIYESACGIGFNLFMTLEILKEQRNITNLTVYGNEYEQLSVQIAHQLFDQEAAPWFRKGTICQGDSTNLSHFVPSDSFDLVYTGSIEPLWDPLSMMRDFYDYDEFEAVYVSLCDAKNGTSEWHLMQKARRAQEDWHASWITEMLRIVKPGKFVIVEDIEYDMCHDEVEWGGLSPDKSWWREAIDRYGWDVYPESVLIADKVRYGNRFNVRLQRRLPQRAATQV